jgi:hypothetical protein
MTTTTETIEGTITGTTSYHYDVLADVLYLRLLADDETETYADMANGSDMHLRDQATDRPVGLTVICWWMRFGQGSLPDSLRGLAAQIEPWAAKVAALAVFDEYHHSLP